MTMLEIVPVEKLEALAAEAAPENKADATPASNGVHKPRGAGGRVPNIDVAEYVRHHGFDADGPRPWLTKKGTGTTWDFTTSPMCEHGDDGPWIGQFPDGGWDAGCHHASCSWGRADLLANHPAPASAIRGNAGGPNGAMHKRSIVADHHDDEDEVLPSSAPLVIADRYLRNHRSTGDGLLTLRRFQQQWFEHDDGYRVLADEALQAHLYTALETMRVRDKDGNEQPLNPTMHRVRETAAAIMARTLVADGPFPRWLDADRVDRPDPRNVVAFRNGYIDVTAMRPGVAPAMIPLTPNWFGTAGCPFDYDPSAQCPEWLAALHDIFDGDAESIGLLQQWMGLSLVPDNRLEQFLVLYGRTRSGKGTVLSVWQKMLGHEQVAVTNFRSMGSRFGLQPLQHRLLAVMPDAHLGGRSTDAVAALEVLKSITGNDPQPIDRKGIAELPAVHLNVRFVMAVNELPRLPDGAGALGPRLSLLVFPNTYRDPTDPDADPDAKPIDTALKARLEQEIPGVANWALQGLVRLRQSGRLIRPEASAEAIGKFREATSPAVRFVAERCELDPNSWVLKADLHKAWQEWCEDQGLVEERMWGLSVFGERLLGASPRIKTGKRGPRGAQSPAYIGIRLMDTLSSGSDPTIPI